MNQHFLNLLEKSKQIHQKKSEDYTTDANSNPFENFERSSLIAAWFPTDYKSFAVLIGTKLARLSALLSSNRQPNNESIDDTFLDLLTYVGLMYSFYKKENTYKDCKHYFLLKTGACESCGHYISDKLISENYNQVDTGYESIR